MPALSGGRRGEGPRWNARGGGRQRRDGGMERERREERRKDGGELGFDSVRCGGVFWSRRTFHIPKNEDDMRKLQSVFAAGKIFLSLSLFFNWNFFLFFFFLKL